MTMAVKAKAPENDRKQIEFYGKANRPSTPVKGIIQNQQFHADHAAR
jgi:hypothetical protein